MAMCEVRFAQQADIGQIMHFLDVCWRKGHILARDRKMFVWQYHFGEALSMVLGVDEDQEIQGVLGFIPYESDGDEKPDVCLALWKANPGQAFLGMRMLLFLQKYVPHRRLFCVGINLQTTERIYKEFGFHIGRMKQWYRLRRQSLYQIAGVKNAAVPELQEEQLSLHIVTDCMVLQNLSDVFGTGVPRKSRSYIEKRYMLHPRYHYDIYLARNSEEKSLLLVLRAQEWHDAVALRLVDCIGELSLLPQCSEAIDRILEEKGAEYIDCYEAGVPDRLMRLAGYLEVDGSGNIIPNYFQPYVKENISIDYAADGTDFVLFRGDGDQDRPN